MSANPAIRQLGQKVLAQLLPAFGLEGASLVAIEPVADSLGTQIVLRLRLRHRNSELTYYVKLYDNNAVSRRDTEISALNELVDTIRVPDFKPLTITHIDGVWHATAMSSAGGPNLLDYLTEGGNSTGLSGFQLREHVRSLLEAFKRLDRRNSKDTSSVLPWRSVLAEAYYRDVPLFSVINASLLVAKGALYITDTEHPDSSHALSGEDILELAKMPAASRQSRRVTCDLRLMPGATQAEGAMHRLRCRVDATINGTLTYIGDVVISDLKTSKAMAQLLEEGIATLDMQIGTNCRSRHALVDALRLSCTGELATRPSADILLTRHQLGTMFDSEDGERAHFAHIDSHVTHGDFTLRNITVDDQGALPLRVIDVMSLARRVGPWDAATLEMSAWIHLAARMKLSYEDLDLVWTKLGESSNVSDRFDTPLNGSRHAKTLHQVCCAARYQGMKAYTNSWDNPARALAAARDYWTALAIRSQDALRWAYEDSTDEMAQYALFFADRAVASVCSHWKAAASPSRPRPYGPHSKDSGRQQPATPTTESAVTDTTSDPTEAASAQPTVAMLLDVALQPTSSTDGRRVLDHIRTHHATLLDSELLPLQKDSVARAELVFRSDANLVISGPTSSGKTFLADVAMLATAYCRQLPVIYVAPTRAVAQHRHAALHRLLPAALRSAVLLSTGEDTDGDGLLKSGRFRIAVLVYEKANILFSTATEAFASVGMVVIDEFHCIEDTERGVVVELLVAKALQQRSRQRPELLEGFARLIRQRTPGHAMRLVLIGTTGLAENPPLEEWLRFALDGRMPTPVQLTTALRPRPIQHSFAYPMPPGRSEYKRCVQQDVCVEHSAGSLRPLVALGCRWLAHPWARSSTAGVDFGDARRRRTLMPICSQTRSIASATRSVDCASVGLRQDSISACRSAATTRSRLPTR